MSNVWVLGPVVLLCTCAVMWVVYSHAKSANEDGDLVENVLAAPTALASAPQDYASSTAPRAVLAYVTPWNALGYDVAKHYRGKFTHVSPVWLQLRRKGPSAYAITGLQDVDRGWVDAVRHPTADGRAAKLVPRVILEEFNAQDYLALFGIEAEQRAAAAEVRRVCKEYGFDGIVLEVWSRVQVGEEIRPALTTFVSHLGKALHSHNLQLVLVIPPFKESFGPQDLKNLAADVDLFSINTYDFSSPANPGPNAPYEWVKRCIQNLAPSRAHAKKILLGLNFYGNQYDQAGGHPITGQQYAEQLRLHRDTARVTWDARTQEHSIRYLAAGHNHGSIFYPSLRSVQARLDLARSLGVSICIWEIGQGILPFYDIL
jgi:chitinase domain-containing protein 1